MVGDVLTQPVALLPLPEVSARAQGFSVASI